MRNLVQIRRALQPSVRFQRRKLLGVPLFDHAEAVEFPLEAVEVPVVVSVVGGKLVPADAIVGLHAFDYVHGKGQPRDPGSPGMFVLQVEPR